MSDNNRTRVDHTLYNSWVLYKDSKIYEHQKLMNTLKNNEYDILEYNQGPRMKEIEFIKYMVSTYGCKVGNSNYHTYLFYNIKFWPINGIDDVTADYT